MNQRTPVYVLHDETKRSKILIEANRRAINYKEKVRWTPWKEVVSECWQIMIRKEETKIAQHDWEKLMVKFYQNNEYSTMEVKNRRQRIWMNNWSLPALT